MTDCDEVVIVTDIVSTKKANTVATLARSIASINCHIKNVRGYYNLHNLLVIILLLIIVIIYCDYAKQKSIMENGKQSIQKTLH